MRRAGTAIKPGRFRHAKKKNGNQAGHNVARFRDGSQQGNQKGLVSEALPLRVSKKDSLYLGSRHPKVNDKKRGIWLKQTPPATGDLQGRTIFNVGKIYLTPYI